MLNPTGKEDTMRCMICCMSWQHLFVWMNVSYIKVKESGILPKRIRHLSVSHWAGLNCLSEWDRLRTLMVNSMHRIDLGAPRSIRVLDLSYSYMRQLPDAISHLIHLRYLDLYGNNLYSLPESLCRLYHLQALIVPDACHRLPSDQLAASRCE